MFDYREKIGPNARREKPSLMQINLLNRLGFKIPQGTSKYEAHFYIETLLKQKKAGVDLPFTGVKKNKVYR